MKKTFSPKEKAFLKKVGEKIRKLRSLNDLSQEDLAFETDLDRTYISGIELGKRNISLITLSRISDALKVQIKDLINTNGK